jgi:hypothetical protein
MKPSTLHLAPPLVSFLGLRPDLKLEAFNRLHTLVVGAAPLGPAAATRLVERLKKPDLFMQEGTQKVILFSFNDIQLVAPEVFFFFNDD